MNKFINAALLGLTAIALVGCGGNNPITGDTRPKVRFVNAQPNLGFNVDATLDAANLALNTGYAVPTTYQRFSNGNHTVFIRQTGSNNLLFQSSPAPLFEMNKKYTVVAVQGATGTGAMVLTDADTPTPATNFTKVRFVNVASGSNSLDVYFAPTGGSLPGSPTASNLTYLGTPNDYITVPSGTFDLRVTANGSTTVILNLPVTLPSRGVVTVLVIDNTAGNAPGSVMVLDDRA